MQQINEGKFVFEFPDNVTCFKYDELSFYKNQLAGRDMKGVDIVLVESDKTWLIEVKDYRAHSRTKPSDLGDEFTLKIRDTLAGLAAARVNANDSSEKQMADMALKTSKIKVILHLEQPGKHSRLKPQLVDPAAMTQKLKQKLKPIDAHPLVVDQNSLRSGMNWKVSG